MPVLIQLNPQGLLGILHVDKKRIASLQVTFSCHNVTTHVCPKESPKPGEIAPLTVFAVAAITEYISSN